MKWLLEKSFCQTLLKNHWTRRENNQQKQTVFCVYCIEETSQYDVKHPEQAQHGHKVGRGWIFHVWESHLDFDATRDSQAAWNDEGNVKSKAIKRGREASQSGDAGSQLQPLPGNIFKTGKANAEKAPNLSTGSQQAGAVSKVRGENHWLSW